MRFSSGFFLSPVLVIDNCWKPGRAFEVVCVFNTDYRRLSGECNSGGGAACP
jgi:hypothetical protein